MQSGAHGYSKSFFIRCRFRVRSVYLLVIGFSFLKWGLKNKKWGYLISVLNQKWKNRKQNHFLFDSCIYVFLLGLVMYVCLFVFSSVSSCTVVEPMTPLKQSWLLTWNPAVEMKDKNFNIPIWILALEHIVKVTHQPEGCNYFWIVSFVKIFTLIFKFKNLRKC